MSETIDVLMATYNGEKYLKEQIESILNQTYKDIRLIISDDCSTDDTVNILKKYEKQDSRVKIYYQKNNLGYVKNFEFLLKKVENDLFMLSDQDDVWLPEKIEKSLKTLKEQNADFVFGDLEVVDRDLNTVYSSFGDYMLLDRKIKKYIDSYKVNYLYNCVTGCTILSKKEYIKDMLPIPCFSKYLVHDHWMALMVIINDGKLAYIKEKLIKYRQHGENQIGTNKISHGFKKLEQVRKLFIDVKLGVFGTYVENNKKFPTEIQIINNEALNYFEMVSKKKNFNFRKWNVYHKLYKTETFKYYFLNFIIMNFPFIGKIMFKIRLFFLKLLNKR